MEKIFYSDRTAKELKRAIETENASEFKRIYNGVMAPVDRTKYTDETMYLEDLEWDLEGKRQLFDILTDAMVSTIAQLLA